MTSELTSIPISELREGEINVRVLPNGKKAIIVRKGDDVRVFGEVCPHLGADMSEGRYCAKTHTVHCKWHGYVFSADDGTFLENPNEKFMRLIRIPSEHFKPEKTPRYRLQMLKSSVQNGRVTIGQTGSAQANASGTTERAEP
ncbi:MAG: Rieske (2Fe-2S) protein [Polyangiaceae bacterium]